MSVCNKTVWKILRFVLFSILHFFATFCSMFAAAIQLRIIDYPDGGEAEWFQLILPAIFNLFASPLVPLFEILLPLSWIKETPLDYIQFFLNSLLCGYVLELLFQHFKKRRKKEKDRVFR